MMWHSLKHAKWSALLLFFIGALLLEERQAAGQQSHHFPTKGERATQNAIEEMERRVINNGGTVFTEGAPAHPYKGGNPALFKDYNFNSTTQDTESRQAKERDQAWVERCNPTIVKDDLGVSRYTYSRSDCP